MLRSTAEPSPANNPSMLKSCLPAISFMARQPEQIKMLQLRLEYISGICIRQCGPVGKSIAWIAGIIPIDKNHEYDTIT
jgi:hypothetical protein